VAPRTPQWDRIATRVPAAGGAVSEAAETCEVGGSVAGPSLSAHPAATNPIRIAEQKGRIGIEASLGSGDVTSHVDTIETPPGQLWLSTERGRGG
jgi:hypothetical protein